MSLSLIHGNYFEPHTLDIEWNFMDKAVSDIIGKLAEKSLKEYPEEMAHEDYLYDMKVKEAYGIIP
ncbi:hypothetical protein [Paenibacillus sp. 481]|uniref:hypothetical protein n=1 Tax=Paenibacillus sp. 481 TaxID=2835869 RepID=UPI001E3D5B8F|nr:hypothetical protein [Paenibacillus sp. 481]UHA72062.1 hypothetical protein KIK04_15250 [Paenibacillus sp. 481]